MDKCGKCGNATIKYDDELLCTKCDKDVIAKKALDSYNKQFKAVKK